LEKVAIFLATFAFFTTIATPLALTLNWNASTMLSCIHKICFGGEGCPLWLLLNRRNVR
jgi:hypothetical protein